MLSLADGVEWASVIIARVLPPVVELGGYAMSPDPVEISHKKDGH